MTRLAEPNPSKRPTAAISDEERKKREEHWGEKYAALALPESNPSFTPVTVVYEETGEEREVIKWCGRCQADSDYTIVSPRGTAHDASDTGEYTRCGIDATGDGWWHRL